MPPNEATTTGAGSTAAAPAAPSSSLSGHRLRRARSVALMLLPVLLLVAPWVVWLAQPARALEVVILDKTVSDRSFREHKGLCWLLNHWKYRHPDGRAYEAFRDYFGFSPRGGRRYDVRKLPGSLDADLVYAADTYGVYTGEFYGLNRGGDRSRLIYGGLEGSEVRTLREAVRSGTTLVAEFNTFASPTAPGTRRDFCRLLGLDWSGWIGRYFLDLRKGNEIPDWAVAHYEKQSGKRWEFRGPGFLLVDEKDRVVVLSERQDFGPEACRLEFTEAGSAAFGQTGAHRYNYWFDIVSPAEGTEVLAEYVLDLTGAGKQQLEKQGIPSRFPAVLRNRSGGAPVYYFCGDFVDNDQVPRFHSYAGWARFRAAISLESKAGADSFYWKVYAAMMDRILSAARRPA